MRKNIIIVSGPPAGGKGYRINALLERLGGEKAVRISLSALSAIERHNQTTLGRWLCTREEKGELFPDATAVTMALQEFDRHPEKKYFIFDGAPRTLGQAQELVPFFRSVLKHRVISVHVTCDHDVCRKRCSNTDRAERVDNVNFEKRLGIYCEITSPMIPYLAENTDCHHEVNGEGGIDEFFAELNFLEENFQPA